MQDGIAESESGAALAKKKARLEEILRSLGSAAVAFSSGVDSTFLLKEASRVLGKGALAVTAKLRSLPSSDLEEARAFCAAEGIEHIVVEIDELSQIEGFAANPPDRCYICKRYVFTRLIEEARARGVACVLDGSNTDDAGDYRPGMRALAELGVKSPLREALFCKADIREAARAAGLAAWDKPQAACLSTRFAYGNAITAERIAMVEEAEAFLRGLGFRQVRVRVHGDVARIEVERSLFAKALEGNTAHIIEETLRKIGFKYAALDLGGYESGSMNRGI